MYHQQGLGGKKRDLQEFKLKKPPKPKKNKSKPHQYVVYKFNASRRGYRIYNLMQETILFQYPDEKTSYYNGNMTIHNPNPMSYQSVNGSSIFITSAYARSGAQPENRTWYNISQDEFFANNPMSTPATNTSLINPFKFISITGWLGEPLIDKPLHCCLLLKNRSVVSYLNRRRMMWYQVRRQPLFATKTYCPIPPELASEQPIGTSLSLPEHDCYQKTFMKIQYPQAREQNTLAFCAKIAYGSLHADRLIEWLEVQRYIGVDKVMIYFYNLNTETMHVLKQYMEEGFVELQPFDFPLPGRHAPCADPENSARGVLTMFL